MSMMTEDCVFELQVVIRPMARATKDRRRCERRSLSFLNDFPMRTGATLSMSFRAIAASVNGRSPAHSRTDDEWKSMAAISLRFETERLP